MTIGSEPTSISGLVAWGTADDLTVPDGADVVSWGASAGALVLTSPGGATPPKFVADAWRGLPGVRFTTESVLRGSSGLGALAGASGCTLLIFASQETSRPRADLLSVSTSSASSTRWAARLTTSGSNRLSAYGRRLDADTEASVATGGPFGWNVTDTLRPHALAIRFDNAGGQVLVTQDGVPVASGAFGTAGATSSTTPAAVALGGALGDLVNGFNGVIHEWALYSRALAEGEIAQVAGAWWDRYGLIPAPVAPAVLPWELDLDAIAESPRFVTACRYITPVSRDNANPYSGSGDVWDSAFVSPDGQSAAFANVGGLWRDRPRKRAPRPESCWWLLDEVELCSWGRSVGIGSWGTDVLSLTAESGRHWTFSKVYAMAGLLTGMRVPVMLDGDGLRNNNTAAQLADIVQTIHRFGSGWVLPDGRVVVHVFGPELMALPGQTAVGTVSSPVSASSTMTALFAALTTALTARGLPPAFMFAPISGPTNYRDALADYTWAGSWWGTGDYNSHGGISAAAAAARGLGTLYAQPIKVQDFRPRDAGIREAAATRNYRNQISGAIAGNVDGIYYTTVGDYNENTQIEPSHVNGLSWAALASWDVAKFVTGTTPRIVRDGVAIVHRKHLSTAAPTDTRNTRLSAVPTGGTPLQNIIEVTSWLTAPARLTITAGSTTTTVDAPAGWSVRTVPLAVGTVSVTAARDGSTVLAMTSATTVTATPTVQDLTYYPTLGVSLATPGAAQVIGERVVTLVQWVGGRERVVSPALVLNGEPFAIRMALMAKTTATAPAMTVHAQDLAPRTQRSVQATTLDLATRLAAAGAPTPPFPGVADAEEDFAGTSYATADAVPPTLAASVLGWTVGAGFRRVCLTVLPTWSTFVAGSYDDRLRGLLTDLANRGMTGEVLLAPEPEPTITSLAQAETWARMLARAARLAREVAAPGVRIGLALQARTATTAARYSLITGTPTRSLSHWDAIPYLAQPSDVDWLTWAPSGYPRTTSGGTYTLPGATFDAPLTWARDRGYTTFGCSALAVNNDAAQPATVMAAAWRDLADYWAGANPYGAPARTVVAQLAAGPAIDGGTAPYMDANATQLAALADVRRAWSGSANS